jgi:hypothetical protein
MKNKGNTYNVRDRNQEDKHHEGHAEFPPPQESPRRSVEGHHCVVVVVVVVVVGCHAHLQHAWGLWGGFVEVAARADAQQGGEEGHEGEVLREPVVVVVVIVITAVTVVIQGNCPNNDRPEPLCIQGVGIVATISLLPIATVNCQEIAIPAVPADTGR